MPARTLSVYSLTDNAASRRRSSRRSSGLSRMGMYLARSRKVDARTALADAAADAAALAACPSSSISVSASCTGRQKPCAQEDFWRQGDSMRIGPGTWCRDVAWC